MAPCSQQNKSTLHENKRPPEFPPHQDFSLLKFSKGWYPEAEMSSRDLKPYESDGDTQVKIGQKPSGEGVWDFPIQGLWFKLMLAVTYDLGSALLGPLVTQPKTSITFTMAGKTSHEIKTKTRSG